MIPRPPVSGTSVLSLTINRDRQTGPKVVSETYTLTKLQSSFANPAWRLTKMDKSHYDVWWVADRGYQCDCPDFLHHRENRDPKGCKHIAELMQQGLLRQGE